MKEGATSDVSGFEVLLPLGEGGMASVVLARRRGTGGLDGLVVLKRLHSYLRADDDAVRRLVIEARIAACVHHENVVGVVDVGSDDDGPFLVLDYVEGATLADLVERSRERGAPLSAAIVSRILIDAGLALLAYAFL